ncbi:MAG: serine--tRNA ligase, partial [Burkholderiales bacterium]
MLDIQLLRNDLERIAARLAQRGFALDLNALKNLDAARKNYQTQTEELQSKRNALAKKIGQARGKGEDAAALMQEAEKINHDLVLLEKQSAQIQEELKDFLLLIPNLPHESVPVGKSPEQNAEVRKVGTPPQFDFPAKDHVDLGENLKLLDFAAASKISGARFSLMKGGLARLHRAIAQFMLDVHTNEHGYTEIYAPYLVNAESMRGTGQLPKFEADLFALQKSENEKLYLVPTAEVPVTNMVRDEILALQSLPLKFVCHSPCFRSEAGSYGKDTRGMILNNQFDKVDL